MLSASLSTSSAPDGASVPAPWQELALDIMSLLRLRPESHSWAFIELSPPPSPTPAKPVVPSPSSAEDFDAVFAKLEQELADEDIEEHPTPARAPADLLLRPRADTLLAILRLAKTLGCREALADMLSDRQGVTVIVTGAPELDHLVVQILDAWARIDPRSRSMSGPFIARSVSVVKEARGNGDALDATVFGGLGETLKAALIHARPIVLVSSLAAPLPAPIRSLRARPLRLASLDREMLATFLRLMFPEAGVIDVSARLPTEAVVSRLDAEALALALREDDAKSALKAMCARLMPPLEHGLTLADFPVPREVMAQLEGITEDLQAWRRGEIPWSDVSRGLLLTGPPGSGKTEIARLLGKEIGFSVVAGSLAQWCGESSRSSDALKSMRAAFVQASAKAPCILFLDELDAFGDRGRPADQNSAWTALVIGGLLELLDGFDGNEGVITIAATNHVDGIDPAIRRAGRFDCVMTLGHLTAELMPRALRWHLGADLPDVDLQGAAYLAIGLTGAEVAAVVREARGKARRARRSFEMSDLIEAITARRPPLSPSLARRVALHEAGHAVAAIALDVADVQSISLLSTGGLVQAALRESPMTRSDIERILVYQLAGRAAERIVFGDVSAGAGGPDDSDLAQATRMAAGLEMTWGQGDSLVWRCDISAATRLLGADPATRQRVDLHLKRADARAARLLAGYRDCLEEIAAELLQTRRIVGDPLDRILAKVRASVPRDAPARRSGLPCKEDDDPLPRAS